MPAVKTIDHLLDHLESDLSWRIKELSTFKTASRSGKGDAKPFLRAGVALTYAHWEGFVVQAAESYLEYVESRRKKYGDLKSNFSVIGLKGRLVALRESKKTGINIESFEFIRDAMGERAKISGVGAIRTANLKSDVLKNILDTLSIDDIDYQTKYNLIDEKLVSKRNKVAHGEFVEFNKEDVDKLSDEMIELMRKFKTDIENAAVTEAFLRK